MYSIRLAIVFVRQRGHRVHYYYIVRVTRLGAHVILLSSHTDRRDGLCRSFGRKVSGGILYRPAVPARGSLRIRSAFIVVYYTDFSGTRLRELRGRTAAPELRGVWLTRIRWVVTMTQSVGRGSN